jgi:2,3-diketo-5-methylthio-1-phosphopentane phosphatase
MAGPALFLDFDNTITVGDVLDGLIERFSPREDWRDWEAQWQAGSLSTRECLARQLGGMRATREQLAEAACAVALDPAFAPLVHLARERAIPLAILSDNVAPVIRAILGHHGLGDVPVFANDVVFGPGTLEARFPHHDPACARCAHCKALHLRASAHRPRIYVGDGLSDVCPALVADVLYAKDSLAREMAARGVPFRGFATLEDVLRDVAQGRFPGGSGG